MTGKAELSELNGDELNISKTVIEGSARITLAGSAEAFYNPVQEFNRDLTVLVLRQFICDRLNSAEETDRNCDHPLSPPSKRVRQSKRNRLKEPIRILDALSASGLRAIRFSKEVPHISSVIANDFSLAAVELIKKNIVENRVQHLVSSSYGDAISTMIEHRSIDRRFDVVDLDPYGSPAQFLDSAVQTVADNGLLMITCTDMAVLCGNTPEACLIKYNSVPLRHKSCHEMALRILLRSVDSHANRYSRYIEPLLSLSVDFYIRVFVLVHTGAKVSKESSLKLSHIFRCTGCETLRLQPLLKKTATDSNDSAKFSPIIASESGSQCRFCAHPVHMGGPLYSAAIHDFSFVHRLVTSLKSTSEYGRLATHDRLQGMLSVVLEELPDVPLYYDHTQLMHTVKCPVPKFVLIRSALLNAGYRVSISHCNPKALKTDAPMEFIWDLVRRLASDAHVKTDGGKFDDRAPGKVILETSSKHEINLSIHMEARIKSKTEGLLRFQCNKGRNWGPKQKTKGSVNSKQASFQIANQE